MSKIETRLSISITELATRELRHVFPEKKSDGTKKLTSGAIILQGPEKEEKSMSVRLHVKQKQADKLKHERSYCSTKNKRMELL